MRSILSFLSLLVLFPEISSALATADGSRRLFWPLVSKAAAANRKTSR